MDKFGAVAAQGGNEYAVRVGNRLGCGLYFGYIYTLWRGAPEL
jgi:hypothetical protein